MSPAAETDELADAVFHGLEPGDRVAIDVLPHDGDLQPDERERYEMEFVGRQSLKAQSRKRSWELRRVDDPSGNPTAYVRTRKRHENNFGFVLTDEGDEMEFDAMWTDPFRDDRVRTVVDVEVLG